jgi:two-component system, NarL family, response regulator LiaR
MGFWKKNSTLIIYGLCLALLFLLLKIVEYRWLIIDHSFEIYAGTIALLFLLVGIWVARKVIIPEKEIIEREKIIERERIVEKETIIEKEKIIEKEIYLPASVFTLNEKALAESDISSRELEVLQLISRGMSNQEIADTLFLSLSTIKTHIANLFFKLDVTRRTQAVEKGKKLSIIP